MIETILDHPDKETEVIEKRKFLRNKNTGELWNRSSQKRWKIVYTKRVIVNQFDTLPFGYYSNSENVA